MLLQHELYKPSQGHMWYLAPRCEQHILEVPSVFSLSHCGSHLLQSYTPYVLTASSGFLVCSHTLKSWKWRHSETVNLLVSPQNTEHWETVSFTEVTCHFWTFVFLSILPHAAREVTLHKLSSADMANGVVCPQSSLKGCSALNRIVGNRLVTWLGIKK